MYPTKIESAVISNPISTVPKKLENKVYHQDWANPRYVEGTVPEKLETKPLQEINSTDTTGFDITITQQF
ncbi:hypothetical protein [Okeania sp.]|uniref:hypothetical protein n=1 Tax=Okeania sp. TaxID=3100323 RepID=UPI002B4B8663|nr:hypothetical protein [Okeania sp.]MEB3340070.1 hypothetical protein [Okeania sp.]